MKKTSFKLPKSPKGSVFIGSVTDISFWRALARMDVSANEKTLIEHRTTRDWVLDMDNDIYYNLIHSYQDKCRWYTDEA